MNLLIIDDDFALLQSLEWALGEDYCVYVLPNARDALATWDGIQPDVVLTDYEMNGMNGLELARAVKALYPRVPVVLMSAVLSQALTVKAKEAGVCACWSKPFDLDEMKEFLRELTHTGKG